MDEDLPGRIDSMQGCEGYGRAYGLACAPVDLGDQLHDRRITYGSHESSLPWARIHLGLSEKQGNAHRIRLGDTTKAPFENPEILVRGA